MMMTMTTMPVVKPGDAAFHIALVPRTKLKQIRTKIEGSSSQDLFSRVHSDQATNVHRV